MGHHKKQERYRKIGGLPQGDGVCPFCHKKVHSLQSHIKDQHRGQHI